MARPLDFSHKLQLLISGRAQPFLAKASPMAVVSHGRFIKAEAAELQDSQI